MGESAANALLLERALAVLQAADPREKVKAARAFRRAFDQGSLGPPVRCPDRPARPERPELVAPRLLPRRGTGTPLRRAMLFHALAHIELNAIDLAADLIVRFSRDGRLAPTDQLDFLRDWAVVLDDEARHFTMLESHLQSLGYSYGDVPAHDGLWQSAIDTRHDLLARLAIVPLVHEARGLDVTPATIQGLAIAGDQKGAEILRQILEDEISHVAAGWRWFCIVAERGGLRPEAAYRALVAMFMPGA